MRRSEDYNNKTQKSWILGIIFAIIGCGLAEKAGEYKTKAEIAKKQEEKHDNEIYEDEIDEYFDVQ